LRKLCLNTTLDAHLATAEIQTTLEAIPFKWGYGDTLEEVFVARSTHESFRSIIILVECTILWGKPERMHVQNIEQLHAHDRHQNVTEHKPQATVPYG